MTRKTKNRQARHCEHKTMVPRFDLSKKLSMKLGIFMIVSSFHSLIFNNYKQRSLIGFGNSRKYLGLIERRTFKL